jgi:elongator complex protein 2
LCPELDSDFLALDSKVMDITADFLSIGGNRNPAAADWDSEDSALLAFGADNSVALWEPQVGLTLETISVQDEDMH